MTDFEIAVRAQPALAEHPRPGAELRAPRGAPGRERLEDRDRRTRGRLGRHQASRQPPDGRGGARVRGGRAARARGPERALGDGHDGARTLRALSATSDEAYLYLRLDVGEARRRRRRLSRLGAGRLHHRDRHLRRRPGRPSPAGRREKVLSPAGLEFCLVLDGPRTGRLLVDTPYDIETHRYRRPWQSVRNEDGTFMEMAGRDEPREDRARRDPSSRRSVTTVRRSATARWTGGTRTTTRWRSGRPASRGISSRRGSAGAS